eukprot:4871152-Amphidinium_carterae.1
MELGLTRPGNKCSEHCHCRCSKQPYVTCASCCTNSQQKAIQVDFALPMTIQSAWPYDVSLTWSQQTLALPIFLKV